jgi:ABC-type transporter Mla MlaB component
VRAHGSIDSAVGLGINGHACWTYEDEAEFTDAALEFLDDGLRIGQRIAFVGSDPIADQRERLDPLGDVGGLIDAGALQLFTLPDLYKPGEPIDPDAQVGIYVAATDAALADGYTGLRVAAQVSDLLVEPRTWEAHVRWESIADCQMSTRPLAALCGYRRGAVPEPILDDLACVHPAARGTTTSAPFHLFTDSDALVLEGEVDGFSSEALDRLLGYAFASERSRLNLAELCFIDHHGLFALAEHTRRLRGDTELLIHPVPTSVERLCNLLELEL